MNPVLPAIVEAAPQWIVAIVLLCALGLLHRHAAQDRSAYQSELDSMATRHAAEVARINVSHDGELVELRSDIKELRGKIDTLERELDDERRLRRQAEDAAALALRRAMGDGN